MDRNLEKGPDMAQVQIHVKTTALFSKINHYQNAPIYIYIYIFF
jgi:hypothetical protein